MALALLISAHAALLDAQGAGFDTNRTPRFLLASPSGSRDLVRVDVNHTPVLRRRISVDFRDVTLEDALKVVEAQSGLNLAYSKTTVPLNRSVRLEAKSITVAAALTELLLDADVDVVFSTNGRAMLVARPVPQRPVAVDAIITGKVTSTGGVPISGATVSIPSLNMNVVTDAAGVYRLVVPAANVTAGQAVLSVVRIGFRPASVPFALHEGTVTVDIQLTEVAISLNQIVVTGTAGNQERRAQAAVVATIDAAAITRTAPVNNALELIAARVPGVAVTGTDGTVGGTSLIRIRGPASISLSNDPLVFVDGVKINSDNYVVNGAAISFLNSLDPNNIESIEVVKGPAAATLYGADASAGVIQIITKRGHLGEHFTQRVALESSEVHPNFELPSNFAPCNASQVAATSTSTLCRGQPVGTIVSDNPAARENVFNNGSGSKLSWQGTGGGDNYNYFLSYGQDHQDGFLPSNRTKRRAVRTNFTVLPIPDLTIDANIAFSHDLVDQVGQGDSGFGFFTAMVGNPTTVGGANNGWLLPHFGSTAIANISDRFINDQALPAITATYKPASWFTNRLTVGADVSDVNRRLFFPRNDSLWYSGVAGTNDGLLQEDRQSRKIYTLDYLGNVKRSLGDAQNWVADLSFGTQLISTEIDGLSASGRGFVLNSTNVLSAAATPGAQSGTRSTQRSIGYLGQLQLGYRDRLFLQYGARVDRNSAFGDANRSFFLPKYGISYVISDESFWKEHLSFVNTMRLRTAYGTTGRSPTPTAALQTYSSSPYVNQLTGAQQAGVVPLNPGNANLRAERGTEFEGGFDMGLWHDRVGAEFTFYNKETKDLLLQRPIPPSLGFTSNPFVNVGSVLNRGIELAVHANIISTENVGLTGRFTMNTLHNEITSLGGTPAVTFGLGFAKLAEGRPLGAFFVQKVTSVDVANNVATVTDTSVYVGSPNPTREGTFSSDLTLFKILRVSGLVEFKSGYRKFNLDNWYREKQFALSDRVNHQGDLPADERIRLFGPYVNSQGAPVASSNVAEDYIEDASFVRFRELSATLTLPARFATTLRARDVSITAGARNLALWTNYRGADPEAVSFLPQGGIFFAGDFLSAPQPQRYYLRLNLGF